MQILGFFTRKRLTEPRLWALLGGAVIALVVGVTYLPGLRIGFWSDDYAFLEIAARLSLRDYLVWYFDPRVQALWYRPIPGMLWWMEWHLFYGNPLGYRVVYVLIHLANCWLLFALASRISRQWLLGFSSALIYSGMSAYSLAVLRPSDETPLAAFFYLLTVLIWYSFLVENQAWQGVLAYAGFILALCSKESSVTLPAILLLVDLLFTNGKPRILPLLKRYAPFALALVPYLIFEMSLAPKTLYSTTLGYSFGIHMFSTLGGYVASVISPWASYPPLDLPWLAFVLSLSGFIVFIRRERRWFFLVLGTITVLAPYVPFEFVFDRFLYIPVMFTAAAIGSILTWSYRRAQAWPVSRVVLMGALGCTAVVNSLATMDRIDWLDRFSRENRIPLRTISQEHPTLPADTLLYFVNTPVPLYGGMFFLKYGPQVSVGGEISTYQTVWRNVAPQRAGLRDHNAAFVYYFDSGDMKELPVSKADPTRADLVPPVDFQSTIELEGYEIASDQVRQGQSLLLLVYWNAERKMDVGYTVFAHLLNKAGAMVAGRDSQPRNGGAPTSSWQIGQRVVDWIIVPISDQVPAGQDYCLEFGLYDRSTMKRLGIVDAENQEYSDRVTICPFTISK